MRAVSLLAIAALTGCQFILGIDDPVLESDLPNVDGGNIGPERDAGNQFACNPVDQSGCNVGEKCAPVVQPGGSSFRTDCVPDGTQGVGQTCSPPPGESTSDNCQGGGTCFFNICRENCFQASGCGGTFACGLINGIYSDRDPPAGICSPLCDVTAQDCLDANHGCYINTMSGETTCSGVGGPGLQQGATCAGGMCFINACDVGFLPLLPASPGAQPTTCGFSCSPVDTHTGDIGEAAGSMMGVNCGSTFAGARPDGPGPGFQCRFVETFLPNAAAVSDAVGICVDPAAHGDCRECDISNAGTLAMCPEGCVSAATEAGVP